MDRKRTTGSNAIGSNMSKTFGLPPSYQQRQPADWFVESTAGMNLKPAQLADRNLWLLSSVLRIEQGDMPGGRELFIETCARLGTKYQQTDYAIALSKAETFARQWRQRVVP